MYICLEGLSVVDYVTVINYRAVRNIANKLSMHDNQKSSKKEEENIMAINHDFFHGKDMVRYLPLNVGCVCVCVLSAWRLRGVIVASAWRLRGIHLPSAGYLLKRFATKARLSL